MLNASEAAGVRWRSKTDMAELFPYELKRGGNRPGPAEMWEEFDAAFERLSITATGTDIVAVAHVFREVWAALRAVADELEGGGRSRVIQAAVGSCPMGRTVCSEVFRGLLFSSPYLSPPPPPCLLGISGTSGAHDYPPSTYLTRGKECG